MDCVRSFAGQSKKATLHRYSKRFPEQGPLFVGKRYDFIELGVCCRVLSTVDVGQ